MICRSLQSKEQNLLISACEFLSEVVFQDFPAEIFLQRPQIIKVMNDLEASLKHISFPGTTAISSLV